ncbi:MAG: hypothetical protein DRQ37_02165 [Gammaproteobacteria bacterium]|nr:MAG: hypothetical protein DRQ37_02165 [Gammaproteobacteria bacterium]
MIDRLLMVGVNYRWLTLAFLVLATLVTGQGLKDLRIDTGLSTLISDADPDRQAYRRVAEEFGSDNRTLVYVRDSKLWSVERLVALEKLHRKLEALEVVERVESILTARTIRGSGQMLDASPLLKRGSLDAAAVEKARKDALANPLVVGNFVSDDGNATALMVTIRPPRLETDFDEMVDRALQGVVESERQSFTEIFQIGPSRINTELKRSLLEDLQFLAPLSAGLLMVTVLIFVGSILGAVVPLITATLSIVWTFGIMGHLGIPLNILSAMLPSLVVVIGSTEDTHMFASYLQGVSKAKANTREFATRFMVRKMGVPLFLTVLTTALGFASNIFSSIELIRNFALASTFAILVNGLITILLVPLLLSAIGPQKSRDGVGTQDVPGFTGLVVRLLGFGRQRLPGPIILFTVLLCGFFVYQASKLHVTNDPFSYFRDDNALISDAKHLQEELAGVKVFFVVLEAEEDRAFLNPENVEKLERIQQFIEKQGIFDLSVSLSDHLKLVNREFHGGDPGKYTLPNKRELVAQYLLFFHRRDIQGYLSHDMRRANILVRHNVSDSRTLNPHIRELKEAAKRIAGPSMRAYVVGENLMVNAAAEGLMTAQAKSLGILLLVIFLIMSAMFTSLKGGFVALVPGIIPIILMFGTMGLLGIALNPGTAMVAVIAVGIAIDGTIHLFSRYNELCRESSDNEYAIRQTVAEEAIPVVATSLALALGFGVLLFSNFTIIAQFGALSAATMLFAVFANLLITPIIMSKIRLVGLYDILAMNMSREVLEESPLFQNMSNYQIRKAILISKLEKFSPGEHLIEQGTFGRSMYLILSGQVEVIRRDGGEERQVAERGAGAVFGEVGYVREIQRTADVRAVDQVEALRFDYERMRKDLRYFPRIVAALNFNISRILGERLAEVMGGSAATTAPDDAEDETEINPAR